MAATVNPLKGDIHVALLQCFNIAIYSSLLKLSSCTTAASHP
jgi:hypothetical protein